MMTGDISEITLNYGVEILVIITLHFKIYCLKWVAMVIQRNFNNL